MKKQKIGTIVNSSEFIDGYYYKFNSGNTIYENIHKNTKFKAFTLLTPSLPKLMVLDENDGFRYYYYDNTTTFIRIRKPKSITNTFLANPIPNHEQR